MAQYWHQSLINTPTGHMNLVWDHAGFIRVFEWQTHEDRAATLLSRHYRGQEIHISNGTIPADISRPIDAYFSGDIDALSALKVGMGGTAFQQKVWQGLLTIRAGETLSYKQLAQKIGSDGGMRAVGGANGANPIGIIVPCHRVIAADATLGGYGGGLARKKWLLEHEGAKFIAPRLSDDQLSLF